MFKKIIAILGGGTDNVATLSLEQIVSFLEKGNFTFTKPDPQNSPSPEAHFFDSYYIENEVAGFFYQKDKRDPEKENISIVPIGSESALVVRFINGKTGTVGSNIPPIIYTGDHPKLAEVLILIKKEIDKVKV